MLVINDEQARVDDMPATMLFGEKMTDIYRLDDGISPVMLFGKTVTGKELLAQCIHNCRNRSALPV